MSCLTVNTQVNKQVVNIRNQNEVEAKHELPTSTTAKVHYPDLNSNEKLTDVVLNILLNKYEDNNKMIELTAEELKKVIKIICNCDEVLIECEDPSADDITCCGSSAREIVYKANVKKILLKYNDRTCLEDFKMHYAELKIVTEDYKINITSVINCTPKQV